MILSHSDGLEKIYKLRRQYSTELELVCLNSEFQEIETQVKLAKNFNLAFPDRVVFKESEFHTESSHFYEISIFCDKSDVGKYINEIENYGLTLDLIHDTNDYVY